MTTHDLVALTSDGDDHRGAGGEVAEVGSSRLDAGVVSASAANSPPPAPPFTADEWDAIHAAVYSDLEDDPYRFGDLLAVAMGTLAGIALDAALDPFPSGPQALAIRTLREMEQRALWGPEQEDHR